MRVFRVPGCEHLEVFHEGEATVVTVSNSGTCVEVDVEIDGAATVVGAKGAMLPPAEQSKWYRWRRDGRALVNYLLDSEVHTFAFSVAANAILSFIPFTVLLYTISHSVFNSPKMVGVVNDMVDYFLPAVTTEPGFIADKLEKVAAHQGIQFFSLLIILIASTGSFLPLEVALNQAWGVTKSRNYLANQVVAFGLAIIMVVLGMGSILLNTGARIVLKLFLDHQTNIKII